MKKWKLWVGIILIFVTGIGVGAAGTGLYVRHSLISFFQEGPPAVTHFVVKRLTRELNLSETQQVAVAKEIAAIQRRLQELRLRNRPEIHQIISTGVDRIKEQLQPEQQEKLDVLITRLKARWSVRMKDIGAG